MALNGSFQSYAYVMGRKKALERSVSLLQAYVDSQGLPALSKQAATVVALRAADGAAAYAPWYLADEERVCVLSEGAGTQLRVQSLNNERRPAALKLAARWRAAAADSAGGSAGTAPWMASWLCAADELTDAATGVVRTSTARREAACELLLAARDELLARSEHQLELRTAGADGDGGATVAVCAFSAPPHRAGWAAAQTPLPPPPPKYQPPELLPPRPPAPARLLVDPALAVSLAQFINSRQLHAQAQVARALPGGAEIVGRFGRAAAFEDGLKAQLIHEMDGECVLLSGLALARAEPAADRTPPGSGGGAAAPARETIDEEGLAFLLVAVAQLAESRGLPLLALASDEETRAALGRHGFAPGPTFTMADCPVVWSSHVRVRRAGGPA